CVEREGIILGRRHFLFHERAEHTHLGGVQLPVHLSSVRRYYMVSTMSSQMPDFARRAPRFHSELAPDRAELISAIQTSSESLLARQSAEGFWCGELTADTTLESDYILLQLWLHQPEGSEWNPPTRARIDKAARSILERQLPGGGFNIYAGGPAD